MGAKLLTISQKLQSQATFSSQTKHWILIFKTDFLIITVYNHFKLNTEVFPGSMETSELYTLGILITLKHYKIKLRDEFFVVVKLTLICRVTF